MRRRLYVCVEGELQPHRICHMREDALARLLTISNVQAGARVLVVDSTNGLVVRPPPPPTYTLTLVRVSARARARAHLRARSRSLCAVLLRFCLFFPRPCVLFPCMSLSPTPVRHFPM